MSVPGTGSSRYTLARSQAPTEAQRSALAIAFSFDVPRIHQKREKRGVLGSVPVDIKVTILSSKVTQLELKACRKCHWQLKRCEKDHLLDASYS